MLDVALFTGDEQIAAKVQRALSFTSARVERMTWQSRLSSSVMARPRDLIVLHPKHLTREQHFAALVRALMRRRQGHVASVTQYGPLIFDHLCVTPVCG